MPYVIVFLFGILSGALAVWAFVRFLVNQARVVAFSYCACEECGGHLELVIDSKYSKAVPPLRLPFAPKFAEAMRESERQIGPIPSRVHELRLFSVAPVTGPADEPTTLVELELGPPQEAEKYVLEKSDAILLGSMLAEIGLADDDDALEKRNEQLLEELRKVRELKIARPR